VLSVSYAPDSTVTIELADAEPAQPERRAVEQALRHGEDAPISKTEWIPPTPADLEKLEVFRSGRISVTVGSLGNRSTLVPATAVAKRQGETSLSWGSPV
jgi:hypothetical protein